MAQTFHQVWQLENKQEEKRLAVFLTRADSSPNRFSKTTYVVLSFEKKEKLSLFSPHSQLQPFFLAFRVSGILLLMAALCNQSITITELSSTSRVVPALSLYPVFSLPSTSGHGRPLFPMTEPTNEMQHTGKETQHHHYYMFAYVHIYVKMPFYAVNHNFSLTIYWLVTPNKTSNHN